LTTLNIYETKDATQRIFKDIFVSLNMKNPGKRFLIKAVIFVLILVLIDASLGRIVRYAFFKQKSGKYYRMTKSFEQVNDSILILGSSHAVNHFYPEIIEKQTGLSCYNAGVEGQRLLFVETLQKIILQRYSPEILILNIEPYYLNTYSRAYNMIVDLYPYYYKYPEIIGKIVDMKSPYEKYKLKSILYQYNSSIAYIIYYLFHTQKDYKGFIPLYGEVPEYRREKILRMTPEDEVYYLENEMLDENFVQALKNFVKLAKEKNIKLLFVLSPIVKKSDISGMKSFQMIKQIAGNNDIPLLDYYNNPLFLGKFGLFNADTHLNIKGAEVFSELFSKDLNQILGKK